MRRIDETFRGRVREVHAIQDGQDDRVGAADEVFTGRSPHLFKWEV
jgi:hypothetical protein